MSMQTLTASPTRMLVVVLRAAGKAATAQFRRVGLVAEKHDWAARAEVCERCPLRVLRCGVSYCGKPFLTQPRRDEAVDGCGCPTHAKAKDPAEHCPITPRHEAALRIAGGRCGCKWCRAAEEQARPRPQPIPRPERIPSRAA